MCRYYSVVLLEPLTAFCLYRCFLYKFLCWQVDIYAYMMFEMLFWVPVLLHMMQWWTICLFLVYICFETYLLDWNVVLSSILQNLALMYVLSEVFRFLLLYLVFTLLTFIFLSIKPQKQSLISEVPKHCYPVVYLSDFRINIFWRPY